MHEYSRILIEEYCRNHKTAKSKRLSVLVEMSYDLYCEPTDDDGIFLENAIDKEKDPINDASVSAVRFGLSNNSLRIFFWVEFKPTFIPTFFDAFITAASNGMTHLM